MNPVFIFGCQRSGTTFLGSLLGAHSNCICIPEFASKFIPVHQKKNAKHDLPNLFEEITSHWRFKIWGLQINKKDVPYELFNGQVAFLLEWIVAQYEQAHGREGAQIWVDHTPENLQYIDFLSDLFPEAKFIHLIRDGRAVFASTLSLPWGPCTGIGTAKYWINQIAVGLAAEAYLTKKKCVRVYYEDIVRTPTQSLQQLCDFLGVSFQEDMSNGQGFKMPEYTEKQHALVGKSPDKSRIDGWQLSLAPRQVEIFEHNVAKLLPYLGYSPMYGLSARPPRFSEKVVSSLKERYKFLIRQRRIIKSAQKKYQ